MDEEARSCSIEKSRGAPSRDGEQRVGSAGFSLASVFLFSFFFLFLFSSSRQARKGRGRCYTARRSMYSREYVAVWAVLQSFVPAARCERSAMAYLLMSITPAGMHSAPALVCVLVHTYGARSVRPMQARARAHTHTHTRSKDGFARHRIS